MKRYFIQDNENWLSPSVFYTIEDAKERIEWYKIEHDWESVEYFTIYELDMEKDILIEIECVSNEREDEK